MLASTFENHDLELADIEHREVWLWNVNTHYQQRMMFVFAEERCCCVVSEPRFVSLPYIRAWYDLEFYERSSKEDYGSP